MTRSSFAKSFNMPGNKGDVLKRIHAFISFGRFYFFSFLFVSHCRQEVCISVNIRLLQTFYLVSGRVLLAILKEDFPQQEVFLDIQKRIHLLTLCTQLILARLEAIQGPSSVLLMNKRT